jgi:hypothetical protein
MSDPTFQEKLKAITQLYEGQPDLPKGGRAGGRSGNQVKGGYDGRFLLRCNPVIVRPVGCVGLLLRGA